MAAFIMKMPMPHAQQTRGAIGKAADLGVLGQDPTQVDPTQIRHTPLRETWLDGQRRFEA